MEHMLGRAIRADRAVLEIRNAETVNSAKPQVTGPDEFSAPTGDHRPLRLPIFVVMYEIPDRCLSTSVLQFRFMEFTCERGPRTAGSMVRASLPRARCRGVRGDRRRGRWRTDNCAAGGAAGFCGPPVVSVIACENTQPGDPPSDWQVTGAGDSALQGFATAMSVTPSALVSFKVNATASAYHVDILRFGYYQGKGARKVATLSGPFPPQSQPACTTNSSTGLIDCGNWSVSFSWTVPTSAVSGIYAAHLVRNDTGAGSLIPFVVRDEASHSDIVVQASDTTWQAYNSYGGNSLYTCAVACPPGNPEGYKGAFKVSYNRPFHSALDDNGRSWLTYAELPMIRFLEANGYDVSYLSGSDVDSRGSLLLNHKVFVSSGHDEYWSGNQRTNVEYARDHGVNLAFFSGNEGFWKTRWEADASGSGGRILVCYKDTHLNAPTDPVAWTGAWRDPRFSPPGDAGRPENSLTGQYFAVNSGSTDIKVPSEYAKLRIWRNTTIASLAAGQSATLGAGLGTLGYEWDIEPDNGFRPAGEFDLSSTTSSSAEVFTDYGSETSLNQTATHHLSLYRAPSGALVFGAGTVQWAWGLDNSSTVAQSIRTCSKRLSTSSPTWAPNRRRCKRALSRQRNRPTRRRRPRR